MGDSRKYETRNLTLCGTQSIIIGMRKKGKSKMGRPAKNVEDRRSVFLSVRLTRAESARIRAEAKRLGISVSDLLIRPWRGGK